MKTILSLPAQEMTPQLMAEMERLNLIIRLCQGHESFHARPGETTWREMYEPKEGFGPHRLIAIRVNREAFSAFGTHPDNEEFWCLGDPDTQPLYLAVSKLGVQALKEKIKSNTLVAEDFILLRIKYNDPDVSYFVMRAGVPHGEAIVDHKKKPAGFYVTESRDLPLDVTELGSYELRVAD